MPTVSIIVPVYNAQNYLHKCIDSLLNQNYEDFELILINDGSKDDSKKICDEYAAKDNRIKVIHKENGGVSSARNRGLDEATGKYIMFCDSDDFVREEFCAPLVNLAEGSDDCLVLAGITQIKDDNSMSDDLCPEYKEGESASLTNKEFCDLYVNLNLKAPFNLTNMPYNKLFCRDIIEKHHIRYDQSIHYNEDFIFNLEYLDKVSNVKIYNKSIYYYYIDAPQSLCKRYFKDIIKMFRAKEDVLKRVIIDKATNQDDALKIWYTMVFDDTNRAINNTFSPSNPASKKEKTRYCTKLIRDKRFKKALKLANTKGYNSLYIKALKLGSFGLVQALKKL